MLAVASDQLDDFREDFRREIGRREFGVPWQRGEFSADSLFKV